MPTYVCMCIPGMSCCSNHTVQYSVSLVSQVHFIAYCYMHTYIHTYIRAYIYCMCVCAHLCMYTHMYVCIFCEHIYSCVHTYILYIHGLCNMYTAPLMHIIILCNTGHYAHYSTYVDSLQVYTVCVHMYIQ